MNEEPRESSGLSAESLEALRKTTLAITSRLDRSELLRIIVEQSVKLLKAKSGGLYEYQAEEGLVLLAEFNRPEFIGTKLKVGEGMAGRLIGSGQTHMVVENYSGWEGQALAYLGKDLFGAVLEVPLQWEGRELGILYVDDDVGRKYSEADIRLLRLLADQAAISLINSALLAEDEKKVKRLERLANATGEMMGNLDAVSLPERLAIIARRVAEILEAETSAVFQVEGDHLVLAASFGHRSDFDLGRASRLKIHDEEGGGLTGYIAYHRRLFKAYGASLKAHPAVAHSESHVPSSGCYSLLAIPLLKHAGKGEVLIGLLRVDNKKGEGGKALATLGFSQEDEWILAIFAEAAVVAMEGAELVDRLKEEGTFRERLISSSPDGIIAIDRDGRVTEFNKRAEEALGYMREEILGQPVDSLYFDPAEPHRIGKLIHEALDQHIRYYETFVRSKSGEKIPILHASTWLLNAHGERVGSVGYFEDLRERKALERRESLLLKASNVLVQAESLDAGLQRLTEMMISVLGRSFCGVLLMDEEGESLILRAHAIAEDPDWRAASNQLLLLRWEGLSTLLEAGPPLRLEWSDEWSRVVLKRLNRLYGFGRDIEVLLAIPLKTGGRVVGQLTLGNFKGAEFPEFSREEVDLVAAIAAQVAVLIDRFQLLETKQRREKLLEALVEASRHLRAEVEMATLQQVIVRLAVELAGCRVGAFFLNRLHLGQLELAAVFGLPASLVGRRLSHDDGVVGRVARMGEAVVLTDTSGEAFLRSLDLEIVAAVPFRSASGEVEAVLCLGDSVGQGLFGPTDIGILEAFGIQAAIALRTAQLMGREQLYFSQLATLHRITGYIQERIQEAQTLAEILHPVLTGVTASYGLGFNRAILMLVDETGEELVGELGIGEVKEEEARAVWVSDTTSGLDDFDSYLKRLEAGEIQLTSAGLKVRNLHLPIGGDDVISEVMAQGRLRRVSVRTLDRLPLAFREAFEVETPVAVAPLVAKNQVIGVLAVDNKFTEAPITDEACDALMTFADTAAVAVDNKRLFEQTRSGAEKLRSFYAMSGELNTLQEPREILKRIVAQTVHAADASWVSLLLIDKAGRALTPLQAGRRFPLDPSRPVPIRPNGISMQVMRTGQAVTIENVDKMRHLVNPTTMEPSVKAAVCLPLSLPGKRIGVMWVHYNEPRRFADFEIVALQLYCNQAAMAYEAARRIETLEVLREASTALAAAEETAGVLRQIVDGARRALRCENAVFWFFDAERDVFILDQSAYSGENWEVWTEFRKIGPQRRATVYPSMNDDWLAIEDLKLSDEAVQVGTTTRILLERLGASSLQAVTLKVGRERLGLLLALYSEPRSFDDEDQETAVTLATRAALVLKKAKLMDQIRRAQRAAEAVAKVTLMGGQTDALASMVRVTREALDCGAVVLFRYNSESGELILPPTAAGILSVGSQGAEGEILSHSLVLAVVEGDELQLFEDVAADPSFREGPLWRAEGIKSCVAASLRAADRKVGALLVLYRNLRRFTRDELASIELLANQVAVSVHNQQVLRKGMPEMEVPLRKRARILLVDNNPEALRYWRSILVRAGYEVVVAESPLATQNRATAEIFDLGLIDLHLDDDADDRDLSGSLLAKKLADVLPSLLMVDQVSPRTMLELARSGQDLVLKENAREVLTAVEKAIVHRVFVVHGHDGEALDSVVHFLVKADVRPVILRDQVGAGKTIIEKFEHYSDVSFSIVLLTPDDVGGTRVASAGGLQPRARQNVIFELGYFLAKLGRSRVAVLYRQGEQELELPSDYRGIQYIPLDSGNGWQHELAREMRAAGVEIAETRLSS